MQIEATHDPTSIVNFDLDNPDLKLEIVIDSPRSLQAFHLTGIAPSELNPPSYKSIYYMLSKREKGQPVPKELVNARLEAA